MAAGSEGQALVEFALTVPVLFLLIAIAINFSMFIHAWIAVNNAARAAADYASLAGASAGLPIPASGTALQNLINADLSSVPNASSVKACVQLSNAATALLDTGGACTYGTAPADSEKVATGSGATYVTLQVDLTYTYRSLIPGSKFLNLPLAGLPGTIHAQSIMRVQQ